MIVHPCVDPKKVYWEFSQTMSLPELQAAYGTAWPREPVEGERTWEFFDDTGIRWGWGGYVEDRIEKVVWIVGGIWPQYRGQKRVLAMRHWLVNQTFESLPWCEAACSKILLTNDRYLSFRLREARDGQSGWVFVGMLHLPDAFCVFLYPRRVWETRSP